MAILPSQRPYQGHYWGFARAVNGWAFSRRLSRRMTSLQDEGWVLLDSLDLKRCGAVAPEEASELVTRGEGEQGVSAGRYCSIGACLPFWLLVAGNGTPS